MEHKRTREIEGLLTEKAEVVPLTRSLGPDCPVLQDLMDVAAGEASPEVVTRVNRQTSPEAMATLVIPPTLT